MMNDTTIFQTILAEIATRGETSVCEALNKLNQQSSIRKVEFFGKSIDLVYIGKDNSILLVKFDFLNSHDAALAWLADEEKFNDERPLYFSEQSHHVSPVSEMECVKSFFAKLHPDSTIFMLLICNYDIINYDDMPPVWDKIGIKVVHRVHNTDRHPEFHSESSSSLSKKEEEEELDKLLEEFVNNELEDTAAEEEKEETEEIEEIEDLEEEEEEEFIDKGPGTFIINELKLFRGTAEAAEDSLLVEMPQTTLRSFNIRQLNVVGLFFNAEYSYPKSFDDRFELNLYNEMGQLLKRDTVEANFWDCYDSSIVHLFYNLQPDATFSWKKGSYLLEIKYRNTLVIPIRFSVGNRDIKGGFIPNYSETREITERPFDALEHLTGLRQVKEQMAAYRDLARLYSQRKKSGLPVVKPPLHAVFMGKPGTGKTTVARLYGSILRELGLLTKGHVVFKERSTLTGQNYASEQEKTLAAIEEADGGVLFIDEAYTLYRPEDMKDPGRNVIETLLTALSDENKRNWALVLAGYTENIMGMLTMNPGLSSRLPERNRYHFEDYTVNELMHIADSYCEKNNYFLTAEARQALLLKVRHDYRLRDENFGNARYIITLFTTEIQQAMALRVARIPSPSLFNLLTIEKEDIPTPSLKDYRTSLKKLQGMVGLGELKKKIESHLNMVKLRMLRIEQGIPTETPPLHMAFTGNPGTGKTTVASFIGEIYASLGLLSRGDVVYVERKDLVGQYIGQTEKNTAEILKRAQGNVLFIDEAYSLAGGDNERDFGPRALEVLLSTLSKENVDMLVILAGYPAEMEKMLQSNRGLKSRIPYTFHFADYSVNELMQIADSVVSKSNYTFTPAARRAMQTLVEAKISSKDEHWGNARFITRLISAQILPAMSNRLAALPPEKLKNKKRLSQICVEDIPCLDQEILKSQPLGFDEAAVKRALKKLDDLIGLEQVKQNIHDFVSVARYMQTHGSSYAADEPLRWNFTGNTGTGKSTVAAIMGELLKAMHLLEKGHLVEVKAEELYNASDFKTDEVLHKAMTRSSQGLLFIDGDAPRFKHPDSKFNSETLRFKLSSMTMELPGNYALIIAENESTAHVLSRNLRKGGMTSFDHTLHFADYSEAELLAILQSSLRRKRLHLSEEAANHMADYIHSLYTNRQLGYANARTMSLLARTIAETYVLRISKDKVKSKHGEVILADVEKFVWQEGLGTKRIGYL